MAGDGGGQDWWGLLYLFFAGLVSVAVDVVRRLANRLGGAEPLVEERRHRRKGDSEDYHHRRRDDDPEEGQ